MTNRKGIRLVTTGLPIFCASLLPMAGARADVVISSAQTQNITCSGGVCTPTATSAKLHVDDLENLLASGNVEVTTTGAGVQAGNIVVNAALTWSATSTLGLDAYQSITVENTVSLTGQGGLSLTTDDGGTGGALSFGRNDSVTFASLASELTIDGVAYALVGSISSLASAIAANPSGSYALADNYDASQDGTYASTPVPTTFTGTFQGLGNTVSNIDVNTKQQANIGGLFFEIGSDGTVANLGLANIKVHTHSQGRRGSSVGALVSENYGLLVGDHAGGVIGSSANSTVGGLVGLNKGIIMNSYATAVVVVAYGNGGGGGLVGANGGLITGSFATGSVTGPYAGGFVVGNDGTISNSYATGSVTGNGIKDAVGGFAGADAFMISDSYSTGKPTNGYLVGGFIGNAEGAESTDCYWDTTTSKMNQGAGEGNVTGVTGLTTQQLKSGLPAGFDPTIWAEKKGLNRGFPYLIANPPEK